jgi:hypothetical protein
MEENKTYLTLVPGDASLDHWMWAYLYPTKPNSAVSWSTTFSLAAANAVPATLTVAMLGKIAYLINPDHHVIISMNGTQVDDVTWDGITWKTETITIPAGTLAAGTNTLLFTDPNDTGAGVDVVYIDWAELDFPNPFLAVSDKLRFTYGQAGTWKYQVSGFSSNDTVDVYDVTTPAAVVRITGVTVSSKTAKFQDTITASTSYWVTAGTAYSTVDAIEQDTASTLQSTTNGADYIAISHADFLTQAQTLSNFRALQGLRVKTVDVQDVYDEFGYGIVGAVPIHDFLAYAYASWEAPAPSYVVLIGDGNYDPKNYSYTRASHIPPYLAPVDPWIGETAADNRYVTLVGSDTLPDMMLGRLSVNTAAEASAFVNKIINYEQSPVSGTWFQKVLAVADNADSAGNFALLSDNILTLLPATYTAQKVYYGVNYTDATAARAAIQAGINAGALIVNYIGHAAVNGWAGESLFMSSDVSGLSNGGKLPVMLPMTCYDGYYIYPLPESSGLDSTGEMMTRADGKGAVASWSPTGLGIATGHDYLDSGFFNYWFNNQTKTIGQATAAGKSSLSSSGNNLDLLDTYLLFGDPAMHFPTVLGDVNGDGVVNATDALIVLSGSAGINVKTYCPLNCGDVNKDGVVNATDALIILSYSAGMTIPYDVGKPGCRVSVTPCAGCQ